MINTIVFIDLELVCFAGSKYGLQWPQHLLGLLHAGLFSQRYVEGAWSELAFGMACI
jgi:hypothetical protein